MNFKQMEKVIDFASGIHFFKMISEMPVNRKIFYNRHTTVQL